MAKLLTHGQLELHCTVWFLGSTHFLERLYRIHMTRFVDQFLCCFLKYLTRLVYFYVQSIIIDVRYVFVSQYLRSRILVCVYLKFDIFLCQLVNNPLLLPDEMNPLLKNLIEGLLCKGHFL